MVSTSAICWLCSAPESSVLWVLIVWERHLFYADRESKVFASGNVQITTTFVTGEFTFSTSVLALGSLLQCWSWGPHCLLNDFLWTGSAKGKRTGNVVGRSAGWAWEDPDRELVVYLLKNAALWKILNQRRVRFGQEERRDKTFQLWGYIVVWIVYPQNSCAEVLFGNRVITDVVG